MDPGYTTANRLKIEENARKLGIPIEIFESDIFESVFTIEKSPCYLCARMRRGHLYKNAQDRGCNKIALGHHFDDVIPLYLVSERDIISWREANGLDFLACACKFTEHTATKEHESDSKRLMIKRLIEDLESEIPNVRENIFKSVENLNVLKIISTKK